MSSPSNDHYRAAFEAARKWLIDYVRRDVEARTFDYERAAKKLQYAPEYLAELRTMRAALGKE